MVDSFEGPVGIIIGIFSMTILYPAWFGGTIGIICAMEALSAYLHCLRLCWIEFNSKFFAGEGTAFDPLQIEEKEGIEISCKQEKD